MNKRRGIELSLLHLFLICRYLLLKDSRVSVKRNYVYDLYIDLVKIAFCQQSVLESMLSGSKDEKIPPAPRTNQIAGFVCLRKRTRVFVSTDIIIGLDGGWGANVSCPFKFCLFSSCQLNFRLSVVS